PPRVRAPAITEAADRRPERPSTQTGAARIMPPATTGGAASIVCTTPTRGETRAPRRRRTLPPTRHSRIDTTPAARLTATTAITPSTPRAIDRRSATQRAKAGRAGTRNTAELKGYPGRSRGWLETSRALPRRSLDRLDPLDVP